MTAEPGWLVNAVDIQSVYGEPADFAKVIAKLETHLQKMPNDRKRMACPGHRNCISRARPGKPETFSLA